MMGSGETAPNVRRAYEWMFNRLEQPMRVAVLETPAGFEPNSPQVAGEIADYIDVHLQNFHPSIELIPARKKGTDFSPDNPELLEPLYYANAIFMGPGSPTYAARQLEGSLAWDILRARHLLGAGVIFTSATTIATSRYTLPVYEIYKVGEDLHWKEGLNFLGAFGLSTIQIPHWNNTSGGADVDTTRCYIGQERFEKIIELLPPGNTIVGLDDHTAIVIDPAQAEIRVIGAGQFTLLRDEGDSATYKDGDVFSTSVLGEWQPISQVPDYISPTVWEKAVAIQNEMERAPEAPADVLALVDARTQAREARDWGRADELRAEIEALGWHVKDTPDGATLQPFENGIH